MNWALPANVYHSRKDPFITHTFLFARSGYPTPERTMSWQCLNHNPPRPATVVQGEFGELRRIMPDTGQKQQKIGLSLGASIVMNVVICQVNYCTAFKP